ncbi:major facilitator superfamily domain-containing protein [Infundibulicybe gibba]|nr:major facilitator superfamily domain-containing protein [Infundibulicybe gibba]
MLSTKPFSDGRIEVMPHKPSDSDQVKGDAALTLLDDVPSQHEVTPEESARVLRKIDLWIMPVILLVFFLQQLDKSSLSYTSVFGIAEETGLTGSQYSWLNSIIRVAQLVWQPITSYLLVRLPIAKYLFFNALMWGIAVACTSAATNFKELLAGRFFLGIFEAAVTPALVAITQMWWRRREQTMRFAVCLAMVGVAGMVGSLLSYGLGHIHGSVQPYQIILLFIGLLTIGLSPTILSSLSYTSVFGVVEETGLAGSQYSLLNSIVYVAQLVWQPITSYLLVRLPIVKYLFFNVLMWGIVVACTSATTNFKGLLAGRFFLGIFEATAGE